MYHRHEATCKVFRQACDIKFLLLAGGGGDGFLLWHAPHHSRTGSQQHAHHPLCPAQGRLQPAGQALP